MSVVTCLNVFPLLTGIPPHVDTPSAFEDGIVSLSLGSQVCHSLALVLILENKNYLHVFPFIKHFTTKKEAFLDERINI